MLRAFQSEWVKLLRRGQLFGSWGTMVGFGLLTAVLLLSNARDVQAVQQTPNGPPALPLALFQGDDGAVFAFRATGQLLGVIALVITAANLATEYTAGTLKVLLVREPRRGVLLGGKMVALTSFILAGITMTLLASVAASFIVANARGIDVTAWTSAAGWSAMAQAWLNVSAAAIGWSLMGAVLAVLFRSGFPAIGVGIAYPLIVEGLLNLVIPRIVRWMPGAVLAALAQGSTPQALGQPAGLGYGASALMALGYAVAFAAASTLLIVRRDVV